MNDHRYDVAIVGFGPTGATAANLLGQASLRVAVFESATSIYQLPRAVHFDGEIMRVFQSIGLAEQILPTTVVPEGFDFIDGDGNALFGYRGGGAITRNGWAGDYMFYQPELDAVLQSGVQRFPNVEVFAGHDVVAITDDGDTVDVTARPVGGGAELIANASYVLGCDGAKSVTRRLAGIELEDLDFNQPWLVIDTMLKRDCPRLPRVAQQICDPAGPATFVPSRGNHRRWEFMLMPGEDPDEITATERVWQLLQPWITPDDAEIVRHVVYTFHAVQAKQWRMGRVLIAGDAAHQMPPFLGQGMCAGIRDAANLAWKLELVLNGHASPGLLDTYMTERAPHVRAIIRQAVSTGNIIQTTDPAVARARDERFRSSAQTAPTGGDGGSFNIPMPRLGDGVHAPASCERSGTLFPQGPVHAPTLTALLDDVIGNRFAIVADAAAAHAVAADPLPLELASFLDEIDVARFALVDESPPPHGWTPVTDQSGVVTEWFGPDRLAIVRPDRYVFGIASPSEFGALVEHLRAALICGA